MADSGYVIYGANGYTGRLIARYAVERGQRPILAGRNARALESMASTLGLHARAFDLGDTAALDRGLAGGRAVLHCAGPFAHTSPPMVDACLRNRVAYLDITGEVPVFEAEELIGIRLASGHYRYDPTTGRFWLAGTVQGGEQIYRGQGRQDYGWYNPRQGSSGYSNHNTGTNIICDGGSCNIAR